MSKDSYDFSDLDAILAEFSARDESESARPYTDPEELVLDASGPEVPDDEPPALMEEPVYEDAGLPEPIYGTADLPEPEPAPAPAPYLPPEDLPPLYARGEKAESKPSKFRKAPKGSLNEPEKPAAKPKKAPRAPREPKPRRRLTGGVRFLLGLVSACLALGAMIWSLFNLHPASGTLSFSGSDAKLRLAEKLDVYVNNAASDALGDLAFIKKIYTLQESDTVSPVPNPAGFGTTNDPAEVEEVIKRAAVLLDGQSVTFDPKADFGPDAPSRYYLDDTILVIAWQEYIEQRCCTFAEVKIAHGSQIRRKLAEDSYSSSVQLYASDMANASNAVVAMNGDFYAFRDLGITVYQRKLYRNNPAQVDSCFFTASGDMLFSRAGELTGEGETQRFIEDNDVVFAVAFGPVLVDDGELQYCQSYPIGEINTEYSRSCIAMTDDLHYLLMTINHTPDARPRATINELARIIYSKNVKKAYTLDGGQTAEIIMMGAPINHVDFGYERIVSDIIYFATALPEEVRS